MRYLVFNTLEDARNRSAAEAVRRGCVPGGSTEFWWAVETLEDGRHVLILRSDVTGLTSEEVSALVDAPPTVEED